jgi:uncharacterized protein YdaU (DUF1376 family)
MADLFWFPMYAREWLAGEGTSMMLPEQEGAFVRLLCVSWGDGSIEPSLPDDDKALAQISRLGPRWKRLGGLVRAQFAARDGRLYNGKLSRVWHEQVERSQRLAESGRKGGRAKAGLQAGLEPGSSKHPSETLANAYQTEVEVELEELSVSPPAGEVELGAALETDADRTALTAIVVRARSRLACVAALASMLGGNDPATPRPSATQFGQALRDYASNGAEWNAAHFRGYLKRSLPRPATLRVERADGGTPPFVKILEMVEERIVPGQPSGRFIRRENVAALGPDVLRAYDAVGGAEKFLNTPKAERTWLMRDFAKLLDGMSHDAAS